MATSVSDAPVQTESFATLQPSGALTTSNGVNEFNAVEKEALFSAALSITRCSEQITWLRREARAVDDNLASMTHTYGALGDASDWADPRLSTLDETITYWQNRYRALIGQLTAARALFVHLLMTSQATSQATK